MKVHNDGLDIDHTLRTIRKLRICFFLKHFVAFVSLHVVQFTPTNRTLLSANF